MSHLALGIAASHSTLMNTHWDSTEDKVGAEIFRSALTTARETLAAARPDLAIVVGSNHFRGLWLDLMPSFTLGIGEVIASGESGTPKGPLLTDHEYARSLCSSLIAKSFDLAFSSKLQVDHGISHAVQYILTDLDIPVIPLIINMFAPPLPSLARCVELGNEIANSIQNDGMQRRVAIIASGGLSHALPWPDWRKPKGDDDDFMVQAWLNGRTDWESYDKRRREIILSADAWLNEEFDRDVLRRLERGEMGQLVELEDRLTEIAGNGAAELRAWLLMAASCGFAPGRALGYAPMYEWRTGMAAGIIELEGAENDNLD